MHWHHSLSSHPLLVALCVHSVNCNSYSAVSSFRGHQNLFCPTIYMHCTTSFFHHTHYSSHYAWVDFTIIQNGVPLTSPAVFDVRDELQSTRFGWIRTVVFLSSHPLLVALRMSIFYHHTKWCTIDQFCSL